MMRGMFSAISGLKNHQVMLDVTANDIANVNTIGYKSARTTFKDSLTQLQRGASGTGGANGGTNAAQVGLGVGLGSIDNLMGGGALQSTGNALDVAIQGEGFFAVAQATVAPPATGIPAGTVAQYTRAGNFTTNEEGYLLTQEGFYVLGRAAVGAGAPDTLLRVPPGGTNVAIGQDGSVSYIPAGGGARVTAGYLSLATFQNAAGLERASGNRWMQSANSGAPQSATPGNAGTGLTSAGNIEMSNVDLAQAFTSMITAQRGFQANSRVISTSDEMLQDLVNLKR
jgi:flagellar hook protein FlgE